MAVRNYRHSLKDDPPGKDGGEFNVFDFTLSQEDMEAIAGSDRGESLFLFHQDPESRFLAYPLITSTRVICSH